MMIQFYPGQYANRIIRLFGWAILFIATYLVCIPTISATHIVGGDLTYRCLGGNMYEITMTMRRDCFLGDPDAQFDDPASIGFFDAVTHQLLTNVGVNGQLRIPFNNDDTLNQIFISDCTIAGNDVCVHQTTYIDTILLPFRPNGYIMAYQRCCRNASLQNIIDPLNTGMTLFALLSPLAQAECNSSPQFGEYPPIYVCVNEPINFDHSAEDVDGDSLVYYLCTPYAGGDQVNNRPQPPPPPPYDTIEWLDPPYNLNNVMGGVPLAMDPETGLITGVPANIGQFVVGICVESYKDGQLIGRTRRDFQFNVRMCRDKPVSDFTVNTDLNCETLEIEFSNTALFADEYTWIFDYGNPNSGISHDPNPVYSYPESGFYTVALIVNDSDSICFDTLMQEIGVFESELTADFVVQIPECSDEIMVSPVDLSEEPNPDFDIESWLWVLSYGNVEDSAFIQNPTFTITSNQEGVILKLIVTSENGCTAETSFTFDANVVGVEINPNASVLCFGDTVDLIVNPNPNFTYTWEPDSNIINEPPFPAFPTETTTYSVTVSDGICSVVEEVIVEIQELPDLSFIPMTDCKSLDASFLNTSTGGVMFSWDFGDPNTTDDTANTVNANYTYDQPGTYFITLYSEDGCDVEIQDTLTVSIIDETFEDETISCFFEDVVLNPDANEDYFYAWTPSEFLNDSTLASPTAINIEGNMTFYVTVTDVFGCEIVDSVMVVVPPDFDLQAPPDSSYCGAPEITLTAGNNNLDYVWTDSEGNILSTENTLTVDPEVETSYILTGTDVNGCEKSDTVTLSPTFFAIEVFQDTVLCPGDSVWIGVINMDPTQDLDFTWSPTGSILTPSDSSTVLVAPESNTTYTVAIMNNTLGCMLTESVTVNVSLFDYTITPASILCLGDNLQLMVENLDTTDISYVWTPTEYIVEGGNTCCPVVSPPVDTSFCVTIINNTYECVTEDCVDIDVSWFDPEVLEVYADPDSVIVNFPVDLSTNQDPDLDFMWSGPGLDDDDLTNPEPTAIPDTDGDAMWCVTVTNADGCTIEGCVSSSVIDPFCDERDIYLPNVFTPNGDGFNDVLYLRGNYVEGMELHIYNRWGQQVFFSDDQSIGWDGTFDGERLAPDVFGFYLEVQCPNEESYTTKGSITLLR